MTEATVMEKAIGEAVLKKRTPKVHRVASKPENAPTYKAYDFDLIDAVGKLHSTPLRRSLLGKIAFACDAYINGCIQGAFKTLRLQMEEVGDARWDSYQSFLSWASGLSANTETMVEAGMDVSDVRTTVQKLFNCRTQCWDLIEHGEMPNPAKPFERPLITDWLRNPRDRKDDPETTAKIMQSVRDEVMDDDGVIDVDMQQTVLQSLEIKNEAAKREALKWDKRRGELSAIFFDALGISEYASESASITMADIAPTNRAGDGSGDMALHDSRSGGTIREGASNEEPFLDLPAFYQFKLVSAAPRYISTALTIELANDRKVSIAEHAKASIEARPLRKAAKLAAEHPKFTVVLSELRT